MVREEYAKKNRNMYFEYMIDCHMLTYARAVLTSWLAFCSTVAHSTLAMAV